ncbi:MAG: hypothetical protein HY794_13430 [Desulfarculus sp.]|nr:hypothetical protein [Desulfarculus sp.]
MPGEFVTGARVMVSKPTNDHKQLKGWTGRLGKPSRGPRVPGKRLGGKEGSWWWVTFINGAKLFRRDELELI